MKDTHTISLNGLAFVIDDDAYSELDDYLKDIQMRLKKDEQVPIMNQVETRIAELLQQQLFAKNLQVVDLYMVQTAQAEIGQPETFGESQCPNIKTEHSTRSGCSRILEIILKVICILILAQVLIPIGVIMIIALILILGEGFFLAPWGLAFAFVLLAMVVIVIPIVMIIVTVISYLRNHHAPKAKFWWISILIWLVSVTGTFCILHSILPGNDVVSSFTQYVNP